MIALRASLVAIFALACSACAVGAHSGFSDGSGGGSGGGGGGGGDNNNLTGDDGGGSSGCTGEATNYVYVLGYSDKSLHSFDPKALKFTTIGKLSCASGGSPFSMAVDRQANAWVNYTDGTVWKVSTKDASCEATSYKPGFTQMGMGFSTGGKTSSDDALFVVEGSDAMGAGGGKFAKMDTSSLTLTNLGDLGKPAELTGTGDGRLFGFLVDASGLGGNPSLAQIDKGSGAQSGVVTLPFASPAAFAFSFWGGRFYFYASDLLSNTTVYQYDPQTKQTTTVVKNAGFIIDGAGVSTCAPVTPPK